MKRFAGRAANQMALLDFLQERGWPMHVEDAVAALDGVNRKKRLHSAIVKLNQGLDTSLRFHGYAEGHGLWWEIVSNVGCRTK